MSIFVDAALLGGGLFYVVMSMSALFRRHTKWFGATTTAIVLAVIYSIGFTSFGYDLGMYSRLWRSESTYMRQVELITRSSKAERDMFPYPTLVDEGPPVRVAFSWGGIIDNWHGIVYDPTSEVLKASEFKRDWSNWNDPNLHDVKKLFGGDMTSARHL